MKADGLCLVGTYRFQLRYNWEKLCACNPIQVNSHADICGAYMLCSGEETHG